MEIQIKIHTVYTAPLNACATPKKKQNVYYPTSNSHKQSLSLRHNIALAYIPSARSSLLLQHMVSKAREGCQPVWQTSSLPGPPTDRSVGHVSRGEQKAQTASQQSPGTASACECLIEQVSCDRVSRSNGVEAKRFARMSRGTDNRHLVHQCTNTINQMLC